jgi:SAM-dependent methyltransferase
MKATLPPVELQASITPSVGDQALEEGQEIARVIRVAMRRHGKFLSKSESVLDFGCGWGRVIRYFDRVPNLWGIDVSENAIKACRETIPSARFALVDPLGPSSFDDQTFDLIYAFSVFSHLSEEAHLCWLEEFERILKPGGLLILTTLKRSFIKHCVELTLEDPASLPSWQRFASTCFQPPWKALASYDRGEYVFSPQREHSEHFGNALIPEEYVRQRWPFELLDYFRAMRQQFIVCRN